jgi:hypothetical protein
LFHEVIQGEVTLLGRIKSIDREQTELKGSPPQDISPLSGNEGHALSVRTLQIPVAGLRGRRLLKDPRRVCRTGPSESDGCVASQAPEARSIVWGKLLSSFFQTADDGQRDNAIETEKQRLRHRDNFFLSIQPTTYSMSKKNMKLMKQVLGFYSEVLRFGQRPRIPYSRFLHK